MRARRVQEEEACYGWLDQYNSVQDTAAGYFCCLSPGVYPQRSTLPCIEPWEQPGATVQAATKHNLGWSGVTGK